MRLAIALGGAIARGRRPPRAATRAAAPSIAVLPFADLSSARDQEYFSDGLAEEVLNALAHLEGLHVVGRTSSFAFRGKADDLRAIAQRLGVASVLEGSVRKAGNRVRVTAQLIDATSGYDLWSETFDRELTDVFAVQDEIARAVAQALRVKLLPGQEPTTRPHRTSSPDVYNHYLLGRQHYYLASQEGFRTAVAEFEDALGLDPGYAPAWAGMVIPLYYLSDDAPDDARARALRRRSMEAAEKAVAIAPDLADGWSARGILRALVEYDWNGAHEDLEKAIALNPGDPHARRRLGIELAALGRADDAISALRKAVELDPLSPQNWTHLGYVYTAKGQLDLARDAFDHVLERSPESTEGTKGLAVVELLAHRPAAALEVMARRGVVAQVRLFGTALAQDALGHPGESQAALEELIAGYAHARAYRIGVVHAARGDVDRALAWLERAVAQRDTDAEWMKLDPLLRPVRGDARFAVLLRCMNLPLD